MNLFTLALRRNLSKWQPMSFVVIGLVLTIGLVASVPLFTNGSLARFLRSELSNIESARPLASLLLIHRIPFSTPTTLEQYHQVDSFMHQNAIAAMGLPLVRMTRYGSTRVTKIVAAEEKDLPEDLRNDQSAGLAFLTGLEEHVEIVLGEGLGDQETRRPGDQETHDSAVEVLVSERFYYDHEIEVGDRFLYGLGDPRIVTPIEVLVKGVWRPVDDDTEFWFEEPNAFAFYFILPEETFLTDVAPLIVEQVRMYVWYLVFDVDAIRIDNVARILNAVQHVQSRTSGILAHVDLTFPAFEPLEAYAQQAATLRIFLLVLSTPILIILLSYLLISSNIMVTAEESEIATLKSRGAARLQIVGLYFVEMVLIGALALGIGLFVARGVTQWMGQVYRFLTFAARPLLDLSFSAQVGGYATIAAVVTIGATLLPATSAAGRTIIAQQQKRIREEEFSRTRSGIMLFFELLLLAGALYGYWRLQTQGQASQLTQDTFVDPLFLLAPTLFVAAVALISLRVVPLMIRLLNRITNRFLTLPLWLTIQQVSRQLNVYRLLLFLLVFTVALGFFSTTFASTLDAHYTDVTRYAVGADLVIEVQWEQVEGNSVRWRYPPFDIVQDVDGVAAATRVLRLESFVDGLQGNVEATLLGIDRAAFGTASWWRDDFAPESQGALMNGLAQNPAGVLVSQGFLNETGLQLGNDLRLTVEGVAQPVRLSIIGVLDYFPTLYPEEGYFFVANLEHIYRAIGNRPYDIWVKLASSATPADILEALRERGFIITNARDSRLESAIWRTDPQRSALFGMLSLGFIVAIVMAGLGFLLHALFTVRQRIMQFGILQAVGLSAAQITNVVVFEKLFLALLAAVGGTLIGMVTSSLFIPLLQVGAAVQGTTPPFVVTPAWGQVLKIYVAFGLMVLITLGILIWQLRRLRIYEAVKLGGME
ncbi:MAG: FtsX-like permease family protein [Chloroflexota bacterium]